MNSTIVEDPIRWAIVHSDPAILRNQPISEAKYEKTVAVLRRRSSEGRIDQVTFEQPAGTLGDLIGYDLAWYAVAVLLAIPLPFLFRLRRAQFVAEQTAKRDEYVRQRIAEARIYSEPNRIPLGALEDRKI